MTKTPVKLRLDQLAIDGFKATGPGWQTRMNAWLVGRDQIVDLILSYEASTVEMRKVLAAMRDGDIVPLVPTLAKSVDSAERQIAMTEEAACAVRKILNDPALEPVRS